jgi:hypothetical protein
MDGVRRDDSDRNRGAALDGVRRVTPEEAEQARREALDGVRRPAPKEADEQDSTD